MASKSKRSCARLALTGLLVLFGLCIVLFAISALANTRLPVSSPVTDRLSPLDKARLEETYHLRRSLGGQVMPGWDQAEMAHVLYNEENAFLVGCPNPPDGWKTIPQGSQKGSAWEIVPDDEFLGQPYYRSKLLSRDDSPQNFIVQVGDCTAASLMTLDWFRISLADQFRGDLPAIARPVFPYTLVVNTFMAGSDQYAAAVLHEAMHAYQATAAGGRLEAAELAGITQAGSYPWENQESIELWQEELDLLSKGAKAGSEEELRGLAAQFLEHRKARRSTVGLSPQMIEFERQREWAEGIAKYAEMSIYLAAHETTGYEPSQAILDDPMYHNYSSAQRFWNQQIDQTRRMATSEGDGRFYYSGMAQAVMLDGLMPGWKERLFQPGVWLDTLLEEALSQ